MQIQEQIQLQIQTKIQIKIGCYANRPITPAAPGEEAINSK